MPLTTTPSTPDTQEPILPDILVEVSPPFQPFGAVQMNAPGTGSVQIDFPTGGANVLQSVFGRTGNVVAMAEDYAAFYQPLGGGESPVGAVDSVFGRTGDVIAQSGDYTFTQIASRPTTLAGYGITDAEHALGNPLVNGYVLSSTTLGIRTWIPMTGGGGGAGVGTITITNLVSGQPYIDVVFGTAQADALWELGVSTVVNTTDGTPLNIFPGIMSAKSTTGFRMNFSGAPDSANYKFHWAIAGTGGGGGGGGVPAGGTTGQALVKLSNTDYDVGWGAGGGSGGDITPPEAPTGLTLTPID